MKLKYISFLLILFLIISCNKEKQITSTEKALELNSSKTDSIYAILKQASFDNDTIVYKKELKQLKLRWDKISKLQKAHITKRTGFYHYNNNRLDSAYYYYSEAKKTYASLSDSLRAARTTMNIATMLNGLGNYGEAEKAALQALRVFEDLNQNEWTSNTLNTLGNIYTNTKNFDAAESYLQKAITMRKVEKDSTLKYHSMNNLGIVYSYTKDYRRAIPIYKKILKTNALEDDPTFIAMVQDNLAHAKFKDQQNVTLSEFTTPLKIRQNENDIAGEIISLLHLSEFYGVTNPKSVELAEQALLLSEKNNLTEEKIKTLDALINYYPPKKAIASAKIQRRLLDSLDTVNRKRQNQFTRIAYETNKKEKENLKLKTKAENQALELARENKRKWAFVGALVVALLVLGVFAFLYRRNKRQREVIETLQRELHHRVKNNLSIIDTFIEVTKDEFENQKIEEKLTELQNRIDSINEVHQLLYSSSDVTSVNLKSYIDILAKNVQNAFPENDIILVKDIPETLSVNPNQSFPVGLIINEFITNTYKYAFDDNTGQIKIDVKELNHTVTLQLKDNGKGLPEDFNINKTERFGLRIIKLLTQQLEGTLDLNSKKGVHLVVKFPKT